MDQVRYKCRVCGVITCGKKSYIPGGINLEKAIVYPRSHKTKDGDYCKGNLVPADPITLQEFIESRQRLKRSYYDAAIMSKSEKIARQLVSGMTIKQVAEFWNIEEKYAESIAWKTL